LCIENTITKFFAALNNRDADRMDSLLDPEAVFYFPKTQPLIGKERILRFFSILFRQYPELSFKLQKIICQGGSAAIHWTNRGIDRRKEPYQNEDVTPLEMNGEKNKLYQ